MDDNQLIAELAKEGLAAYKIGHKFGLSARAVIEICARQGVEVHHAHNRTRTKVKHITELLQAGGYTQRQICEIVNCEPGNVRQVRYLLGIKQEYPHRTEVTERNRKKAMRARDLVRAGMTVKEACSANRISTATYHKYQKLAQIPRLNSGVQAVGSTAAGCIV